MNRYSIQDGSVVLDTPASVWICAEGSGTLVAEDYTRDIRTGDYFFLPAAAAGKCTAKSTDNLKLICCVGGK